MIATQPLPDLSSPCRLTKREIESFRRNGHVLVRAVAPEIGCYRAAICNSVDRVHRTRRPLHDRDAIGSAFLQTFNLWLRDEAVSRFVFAPRFARIAASLLGVERVRLYHDQALFKEPGGGRTPWHQDRFYNPLDPGDCVTMWMPLVDVSRAMGVMDFVSRSHQLGSLGDFPVSDDGQAFFERWIADSGLPIRAGEAMAAGDATFHSLGVVHGAPANRTDRMREVMTVIYYADGARVRRPDNAAQDSDLKSWLPGCRPGELAVSPLNPILYDASEDRTRRRSARRAPASP